MIFFVCRVHIEFGVEVEFNTHPTQSSATKMANSLKLYEVHSFSISTNSCQSTRLLRRRCVHGNDFFTSTKLLSIFFGRFRNSDAFCGVAPSLLTRATLCKRG